ncbi:DUF4919 domain-containing protein [Flammeovirga sp. SJP92]|uniref:DUF4919 domain-containing protein n=1 Tax=Flammeovirga sp. SJP92 TaxID=1775430 RepID=UPI000789A335|nr:DUF4919 domain-containing protein [Flammeovirga sp. SJP92]KXX69380.1 hypothetical protein AVL50_19505 [Flammeovirga sp. SJP92]
MKKYLILLLLNLFIVAPSFCQNLEEELDNAITLMENEKIDEAIVLLDSLIAIDSVSKQIYYLKGSSHYQKKQYALSIQSYQKALELDPTYDRAIFNLANGYEMCNKPDSAEVYFRKYLEVEGESSYSYIRLANTLSSQGKMDSVMYYYERAYEVDTTYLYAIYTLAQEYFIMEDYVKSEAFIEKGKALDEKKVDFYTLQGALESSRNNYNKVIEICEKALTIEPTNFEINRLYIESTMLLKTDPQKVCEIEYETKFVDYGNTKLEEILGSISEKDYEKYLKRIKTGEILSLEDYLRFYLSQIYHPNFSPYFNQDNEAIKQSWNEENYEELVKHSSEIFNNVPLKFPDLYKVCSAYYSLDDMENFRKYYAIYYGVLESILATGNGSEPESAYIVVSASDEYDILYYTRLNSSGQSLVNEKGHSYDILTTQYNDGEEGKEKKVYFNIDIPMKSLHSSFSAKAKKGKKKKKRKNK